MNVISQKETWHQSEETQAAPYESVHGAAVLRLQQEPPPCTTHIRLQPRTLAPISNTTLTTLANRGLLQRHNVKVVLSPHAHPHMRHAFPCRHCHMSKNGRCIPQTGHTPHLQDVAAPSQHTEASHNSMRLARLSKTLQTSTHATCQPAY